MRGWFARLGLQAPRRLTITRSGKCLIAIALAAGLAALNTGNNPLFLAWGMVLGAMVVSGVLSEAALRPLAVTVRPPEEARANTPGHLRVRLTNSSRILPALAIEVLLQCEDPSGASYTLHAPYELRLNARQSRDLFVAFVPKRRGAHTLTGVSVRTAYPFGLFIKERLLHAAPASFVVLPAPGLPQPAAKAVAGHQGQHAAAKAGGGEDYFATRAYRAGDPLKHVLWRRVGKTGRWLVVEREAKDARRLMVVLQFGAHAQEQAIEAAISAAGTWMEQMLAQGMALGLSAPGIWLAPEADLPGSHRQRRILLLALAQLQPRAPMPKSQATNRASSPEIYLVGRALQAPEGMQTRAELRVEAAT